MADLSVMILCGQSPRHLYVANRLCAGARPVAIVQEAGSQWTAGRIVRQLKPGNLWRKGWRWLRDRRRYMGGKEASFFFGEHPPRAGATGSPGRGAAHQSSGRRRIGRSAKA